MNFGCLVFVELAKGRRLCPIEGAGPPILYRGGGWGPGYCSPMDEGIVSDLVSSESSPGRKWYCFSGGCDSVWLNGAKSTLLLGEIGALVMFP